MNHGCSALEDRIVVGWGPPERVDGKLLGYKLYWCEAREDSDSGAEPDQAYNYFEVRLGKDTTTFAAENLVPGQDYRFQILACEPPHPLPASTTAVPPPTYPRQRSAAAGWNSDG